jgi:signal transduction histidine kinase
MNEEFKKNGADTGTLQKLTRLLAAPVIEPSQRAARIQTVERDIVLPLRLLIIAILGYYFFFSGWFNAPPVTNLGLKSDQKFHQRLDDGKTNLYQSATNSKAGASSRKARTKTEPSTKPGKDTSDTDPINSDWNLHHAWLLKGSLAAYAALTLFLGAILIWGRSLTLPRIEWMVFATGVLDCILMGMLTFMNKGFDSALYWIFVALILHNALSIPVAFPQLLLNFLTIGSFVAGGILDDRINPKAPILDVENISSEKPFERIIVLVAWALCCYGIQVLFEKQKRAEAEATEFAVRQERLRTAGRLAAEIAHQIKNPLGIITNAAFCLQRAVRDGEMAVDEQVDIIREEVDRADQIITELMGYAQLAEGTVESLQVADEMDNALLEVFPPAAKYQVKISKSYDPALPALLMQKRHLSGVFVNLLQNAREAMNGHGEIEVSASYGNNDSIRIQIADNGPGIATDKIDKIFEAYFTTREKGTGLGLAIVKHNTEMYGGRVNVQSMPGRGTQFTVEFPARILMRLSK